MTRSDSQDSSDRESKIAAELLATVGTARVTVGHKPIPEESRVPFEHSRSVIHPFCIGCGNYTELECFAADDIAADAGITLPESLEGKYRETTSCSLCGGEEQQTSICTI